MNLWILTEERPKKGVIVTILEKYLKDRNIACFIDKIRIIPILENGVFTFKYEIIGFKTPKIGNIYIKIISGSSSFVDFLIFETLNEPTQDDIPIYAIEETKTDDKESRNTGVYQRCSKFVYIDFFYPNIKKIMLYNLQINQKKEPTLTYIFGTKMLKTLGVEILGKSGLDDKIYNSFSSIDELIEEKNSMPETKNGISVKLTKTINSIEISAKLEKSGRLAHDPNIGMTTIISAVLRKLGWSKEIVITKHNLPNQQSVGKRNKFIQIANRLDIKLDNLQVPQIIINQNYWRYDYSGEKIATIFLDIVVEEFSQGFTIYHNHAGAERGYFITSDGERLAVEKYNNRAKYKKGDKTQIIALPDLVLLDNREKEIINIEGEMYKNAKQGIEQLNGFEYFEKSYILKYYPKYEIVRTVILYGGDDNRLPIGKISFVLNTKGEILLNIKAPKLFIESFKNIFDYWS